MPLRTYCVMLAALFSSLLTDPASATERSDGTVSGSATVTLRPVPARLRMQMVLKAHGKTPEVAIENLKARREAAATRLKDLKAEAESISFFAPRVGNSANANVQTVPLVGRTIIENSPGGVRTYSVPMPATPAQGAPTKKLPTLYTATTVLRAEWPLADEGPERLAATVAEIQEKVRSAKLAEGKEPQNLSAEDQELIEEAQMGLSPPAPSFLPSPMRSATTWTESSDAGPVFVFVAELSDAQRKAALARAYAQAKSDAAELAEAAGMRLGPIASLRRNSFYYNYSPNVGPFGEDEGLSPLKKYSEYEAVATHADGLEFSVGVSVEYRLLPAGSKP